MSHPCVFQLQPVGRPQIKMHMPIVILKQARCVRAEGLFYLCHHIRTNFVMIRTNGWTDGRKQVCRDRAVTSVHLFHRNTDRAFDRAHPTGMDQSDHMVDRVVEEDRDTVGKAHHERDRRLVGKNGIGLLVRRTNRERSIGDRHVRAMYLPDIEQAEWVASQGIKGTPTVFTHPVYVIAHRAAQVERIPWLRADAAVARKNGLDQVRAEGVELEEA